MTFVLLKLMAMLFMTVDHVGAFFLNNNIICRGIGRAAFPLFIFMFCEGLVHTHAPKKRILRIFILALVTEPIFDFLVFDKAFCMDYQNVLFLFALTGLACFCINKTKNWYDMALLIAGSIFLAEILKFDYGALGAASIFICYYFVKNKEKIKHYRLLSSIAWLPLVASCVPAVLSASVSPLIALGYAVPVFIICGYNGKKGSSNKILNLFMLLYYPLHLAVLLLVRYCFF